LDSIVVVKFGGSVLSDERSIDRAAQWIGSLQTKGVRPVVVVSALRGVTDDLLKTAQRLNPEAPPELMDEVLAMGERTSARLFSVALSRIGIQSVVVDPDSTVWPVITDDKHLDATPILSACRKKTVEGLRPLVMSGKVPVVAGYVGISESGRITTLGRGGSDTTAVLLANCLAADEVVLVKDVGGIHTADPHKAADTQVVEVMSSDEVMQLTLGGAKIVHPKALQYLRGDLRLRIGTLETLEQGGTIITPSGTPDLDVSVAADNVTMVTLIGKELGAPQKLSRIVGALEDSDARLISASIEENSLILYLQDNGKVVEKLHDTLVKEKLGKAISHFPSLSMVNVSGKMLETIPGIIHRVAQPLAAQAVNVYGLVTISSSVRVFVSSREALRASQLIRDGLQEILDETV